MGLRWQKGLLFCCALSLSASCASDFDQKRRVPPRKSLGDEIYAALCDRVGATVLPEDLTGASYHGICHTDASGNYADTVDESELPPAEFLDAEVRRRAIAALNAMVRRRGDLVRALNATFDDGELLVPFEPGKAIHGHDALDIFLKSLAPLYDSNPVASGEPSMPGMTRAAARFFAALGGPGADQYTSSADAAKAQAAREALARLSGRQGYRPLRVALGAVRPGLAYPGLRDLAQTLTPRMGPNGPMRDSFQNVLGALQFELGTSVPTALPPTLVVDPNTLAANRPRTNLEVARAIMLAQDPAFAVLGSDPRYIVSRGPRGFALPSGNVPGVAGTVSGPFADLDNDGLADVDAFGRFLDGSGQPSVDTPFFTVNIPTLGQRDSFGRAVDGSGQPLFQYVDASQTYVAAVTKDLEALVNPDPAANHQTMADLLSGAFKLYGTPTDRDASWAQNGKYPSFDTSDAPLVDLIHATGQVFAHRNSDVHLKLVKELFQNHPQVLARVIGAALKVREIANKYPDVVLDPKDTFWDEFSETIVALADKNKNGDLFKDLMRALKDPNVRQKLGVAFGSFNAHKDLLSYDPNNLNGPAFNKSTGNTSDPMTPVDFGAPDTGNNRSLFHRTLQLIHDGNGVTACNKQDARICAFGVTIDIPLVDDSWDECALFVFEDLGMVLADAIQGKASLNIRSGTLNTLITIGNTLGVNPDSLFESGSGVNGLTLNPSPQALNRMVFFGADSPKFDPLPDHDMFANGKNDDTNCFISSSIEAVSSVVCPERPVQDPRGQLGTIWVSDCSLPGGSKNDLVRIRDVGTIFAWERLGFYDFMKPLLTAYDKHNAVSVFMDQMETFYRHWPTTQHGPECTKTDTPADRPWQKFLTAADKQAHKVNPKYNPRYCSESGVSRYEPILAEAFVTDLIPAMAELVTVIDGITITDKNGQPHQGLDVMQELTQAMFDPAYAASVGMTDRNGNAATTWADGVTPKPQLTTFDLFARAMQGIEDKLAGDPRRDRWKQARSQIVDQFLTIDGEGASAQFRNPALPKIAPVLIDVIRAQINGNCPDRETSGQCPWGTTELGKKMAETIEAPTFSTTMHLIDRLNEDPDSRREVLAMLQYLTREASSNNALTSTLTSMTDMMQILSDDENMPPIYNAIAVAAAPDGAVPGPGTADRMVQLMQAMTEEPNGTKNPYDPYRVLDRILLNLVSPIDANDPNSVTPIEIFIDTIAEVNRSDASVDRNTPMSPADLEAAFGTVRDFLAGPTRGMEQFYEIVKHRDGD